MSTISADRTLRSLNAVGPDPRTELPCRQKAIARLLVRGLSNRRIGAELGISTHTVRDHVSAMLVKFRFDNRVQLATFLAVAFGAELHSA